MTVRTRRGSGPTPDRWLVSYVDVLTILLIFFLAAAANTSAVAKRPPAPSSTPSLPSTLDRLAQTLAPQLAKEELSLKLEPRGLTISVPQAILFSPGDDQVSAAALPTLEKIARAVGSVPNKINLAGYADSIRIHNRRFRNNWDLAAARGLRLMELLTSKYDLDPSRFSVSSYGSNDPRSTNDTEDGRASNRRVEIVLMNEGTSP
jgi:chemotaxis protein MotB